MQKKVGTLLDESILKKAKEKALLQHTTLNRIFTEALSQYLSRETVTKQRFSSVESSFGASRLPVKIVRKIAQEEIYEIG